MKMENRRHGLKSIRGKVLLVFIVGSVFLMIAIGSIISSTLSGFNEKMVLQKETTDIQYLDDTLGNGQWCIRDNTLYKGDVCIGDGTEKNANIKPFEELEKKTGTFYYTFIHSDYVSPDVIRNLDVGEDERTSYLRAAGSTRDEEGNSIVGTYMDKAIADYLSENDEYAGVADVEGSKFYCLYRNICDEDGNIIGVIVVGHRLSELFAQTKDAKNKAITVIVLAMLLVLFLIMLIIYRWVKSLDKANEYIRKVGTGDFPEESLVFGTNDEMDDMAESINVMTKSLRDSKRIVSELSLARGIQRQMLPSVFPEYREFDLYALMNPAKEVGGDFYDFFMVDEKRLGIVIADVSGKGIPAALFMVIAKTLIKSTAFTETDCATVFSKVNKMLCDGNDSGMFVTAFAGVLNLETGSFRYVNAGHNPPLIRHGDGGYEYLKVKPSFVMGGMDSVIYREFRTVLEPGDRVFLYTDGVTEAINEKTEMFGDERLKEFLNRNTADDAKTLIMGVKNEIDSFAGEAEQFDDITMLALYFHRKKEKRLVESVFDAKLEKLDDVMAFVEGELEKYECPMKQLMAISVAVEEIFVNVAHYAYREKPEPGDVAISVAKENDEVIISFTDSGKPFNPLLREDPDITLSAEDRKIGGLGIYMVKQSMDDVLYEFVDGKNVLKLVKKI